MLIARDPVREASPGTPAPTRRVGIMLLGAVLAAAAALFLLPMLLALVFDASTPLADRVGNLVVFGVPAGLVFVAGIMIVRAAAGLGPPIRVRPTTVPGRWAVGLVGGSAVVLAGFMLLAATGWITGGETFFENLLPAIALLAAWASGFMGLVAGVVAMAARGERSMTVLAAIGAGLIVSLFGIGEVLFPH